MQLFSASAPHSGPTALVGARAPLVALDDDRGYAVSLAQYGRKVVLMNLWATWCPPCREELPDLQRLYAQDARRGLVVIGVDEGEAPERVRAFAAALGLHFPIWIDSQQAYGRAYDALGFPTTVVIDASGRIVRAFDGPLTPQQMRSAVDPFLTNG